MPREYRPYVPQTPRELLDLLGLMMLSSPTFADETGYFPERSVDTVFSTLSGGLKASRKKLGEGRYRKLTALSDQMRAYFEADPNDSTGEASKGRKLIHDMEDLIKDAARHRKA